VYVFGRIEPKGGHGVGSNFTNLTNLEVPHFNEDQGFTLWQLLENIFRLTKLKSMVLTTCMVYCRIPATIGNMTSLVDLELSENIVDSVGLCFGWVKQG
jgi:hypothetical protein